MLSTTGLTAARPPPPPLPRLVADFTDAVAVYKPPGVPFHHASANHAAGEVGILHTVRQLQADGAFGYAGRLFPVHRLDTVTSGILLFAKTGAAAGHLAARFRSGDVHKYYVALSARRPVKKQGSIVGDMEKARRGAWKLARTAADPAVTRFASFSLKGPATSGLSPGTGSLGADAGAASGPLETVRDGLRLYVLKPETGRTHQLRVAMKCLGAPILGDELYDAADAARQEERTYLHAAAVRLRLGSELIQAVLPPCDGQVFTSAAFRGAFAAQFDHCTAVAEIWFPDSKLLRSDAAMLGAVDSHASGESASIDAAYEKPLLLSMD